ncbi:MAG: hypothetical protein ACI8SE_000298 [Bacteroidia bacterium]|jgi:hypothetical protein
MKIQFLKSMLVLAFVTASVAVSAQYPKITIKQLQDVSAANLAACNDSSSYFGDTVTVVAVVVQDANLIDVPSSSVQGGFRPFVHVLDTANSAAGGDFHGLQVMGVYTDAGGNSLPVTDIYNLYAGMVVELTGIVGRYLGETQLALLNNSSMTVLGSQVNPAPLVVDLGDLNDNTRTNQIATGEEFEDSYVELKNVTVTATQTFSGNRVSFDVADGNGNVINVSDRFFAQKTTSYTTTRSSAPTKQGKFVLPVVGSKFDHIRGIIMHSENGCSGGTGRGYEINPTRESDYKIGKTPPNISNIVRTPLVPKADETVKVSAKIIDFDGTIASAKFFYSDNLTDTYDKFTEVVMTLKSGTTDTYEAEVPGKDENTIVRYYFYATDDIAQESFVPFSANASSNPDYIFYTVRNGGLTISDVQRVLNVANDASPFNNQEVTVTGVVTASAKSYDLEQIYIQDPIATIWAGIKCQGNSDLIKLYRGQEVTVTGTVAESFGYTVLNVTNVVKTGAVKTVPIVTLDPSDSAFYFSKNAEAYESMLVGMVNPAGGKVFVSNPRLNNFGEYQISTDQNASYGKSRRVQAGIQNTNNTSSLWVSLVSDTTLKDRDGSMNVAAIEVTQGMSFDTVVGIMYYGFNNYNLIPRNNDDFIGSSVVLPETDYPEIVSVKDVVFLTGISFYPNPAVDDVQIDITDKSLKNVAIQISDLNGKMIMFKHINTFDTISVTDLSSGMYIIHCTNDGQSLGSFRLIKK